MTARKIVILTVLGAAVGVALNAIGLVDLIDSRLPKLGPL